jgi:hypothetical protein
MQPPVLEGHLLIGTLVDEGGSLFVAQVCFPGGILQCIAQSQHLQSTCFWSLLSEKAAEMAAIHVELK